MMTGIYQHSLDAKGRLFIPAKLREELGDTFYLTLSMDHCLNAYSQASFTAVSERMMSYSFAEQRAIRMLFANASKCELDGQGRILIPQILRESAGLTKNVAVVGCNNHAELWDSEEWAAVNAAESTPENIAAVMEALRF